MKRRTVVKSVGGVGALGAVAFGSNALLTPSSAASGTIEAKSITGRGGDESHSVLAHEGTLVVDDTEYRDEFSDWQDVTVDDELAGQFETDYEAVYYDLHVGHETATEQRDTASGETLAYRTDRTVFNSVQVGDAVQFSPTDTDVPRIGSLE
jgi:hypothetical protein